jgi:hypothetical protein
LQPLDEMGLSCLQLDRSSVLQHSLQLFLPSAGGEASLWDIPINSSTQGPILEQLQLQHKVSSDLGCV